MIRITYGDTTLILGTQDSTGCKLEFTPDDETSWVPVIDQSGFKLEYLSGGVRVLPDAAETPASRAAPRGESADG